MGFTTPCFIYKNTLKLQGKLKILGYVKHPMMMNLDISSQFLICNRGFFAGFPIGYQEEIDSAIDCGTNEELFLAIAALRDDTDNNQWFVMDVEIYVDLTKGTWFQATDRDGGKHVGTQIEALYCHKATVEELINYFDNKR